MQREPTAAHGAGEHVADNLPLATDRLSDGAPEPSIEASLDALIVIDQRGLIHTWNLSAEEIFGYSSSEARGKPLADLIIPPEHREAHASGLLRYLETGVSRILNQQVEVEAMRRNGERFPAVLTVTLLPGDGEPLFAGSLRDISRQLAAEAERSEIEKRFRTLIEQLPVVVFTDAADAHMTPLYVSPQIEQLLDYTPEEWLADPDLWVKRLHPDDKERVRETALAVEYGPPFECEYRMVSKHGRTVWVREETVTIFNDDGVPWFTQGVFIDITGRKEIEERTRAAEARYRSLVEQTPAITFRTAPDSLFTFHYVSPQIKTILGYEQEEWLADPTLPVARIHPEDRDHVGEAVSRSLKTGQPITQELRLAHADGRYIWISANAEMVRDEAGSPLFWQGVMTDITDRRTIEDALTALRSRYRHFAEHANDAIIAVDLNSGLLFANPAFQRMCGYSEDELCRMNLEDVVAPGCLEHARAIAARMRKGDDSGAERETLYLRTSAGEMIVAEVSASPIISNLEVIGFQAIIRDVTARTRFEAELARQAFHDDLTSLPNRASLLDLLQTRLSDARTGRQRHALIFLDLDNFKVINDSLGHDVGDRALVAVGKRIRNCLREQDFVARFGGDEFVILLEDLDRLSAVESAQRIVDSFDDPFRVAGRDVKITASIGIAEFADGIERPEELLRRADLAMYSSKDRGRNRYAVHDREMDQVAFDRLDLEGDLRQAIERDELSVLYQPVVWTSSGDIRGVEALVRWRHPERGELAPDDFIPIAEESGLIVQLDRWVLREAVRQMQRWIEQFDVGTLNLSVNISARQLDQPDLVTFIDSLFEEIPASLPRPRLIVEITETAMMKDVTQARDTLDRLHARGVRVALDDFGMGYSSLAQIRHLPIDYIKIDRQFIAEISDQQEDLVIVSGMIDLSHSLGLSVIAEGVETQAQARLLDWLRCEAAQGYYYSRPCSASAFTAMLACSINGAPATTRPRQTNAGRIAVLGGDASPTASWSCQLRSAEAG